MKRLLVLLVLLPQFALAAFPHFYQGEGTLYCGETAVRMMLAHKKINYSLEKIVEVRKEQVKRTDKTFCSDLEELSVILGKRLSCQRKDGEKAFAWVERGYPIISGIPGHWQVYVSTDKYGNIYYLNPADPTGTFQSMPKEQFIKEHRLGFLIFEEDRSKYIYQSVIEIGLLTARFI